MDRELRNMKFIFLAIGITVLLLLAGGYYVTVNSAPLIDTLESEVICSIGYPGTCPSSTTTIYTTTQTGWIVIDWYNVSDPPLQDNETSQLALGINNNEVSVGGCDPIQPGGDMIVFCGHYEASVSAGSHIYFMASHLSNAVRSGSHHQRYEVSYAQLPTPVVTSTMFVPTPTPEPSPTPVPDCFLADQYAGEYCSFWPAFFRQGIPWGSFGSER